MIKIDYREPKDLKTSVQELATSNKIDYTMSSLDRGDFVFSGRDKTIVIERKTINDFISSILDNRAPRQLNNMLDRADEVPILGLDGFPIIDQDGHFIIKGVRSKWTWNQLLGMLTTLQQAGLIVHWVPSDKYPEFIIHQYKYWNKASHGSILSLKNRDNKIDRSKLILMAFPSIGAELADKILRKHPLWQVLADPRCTIDIDGMGNDRIQAMRDIIFKDQDDNT